MRSPIRILHVVTVMNLGGIETFLMTLYRNIDRTKVQFDFLVHRDEKGFFDDEIKSLGGRIFRIRPLNPLKLYQYKNELQEILNRSNYKTVHSHLNANSTIILFIAKKIGVKHRIAHSHISSTNTGIKGLIKRVNKLFINAVCNYRFACSEIAGNWLFGSKRSFKIFKNAIDTSNFMFSDDVRIKIRKQLCINDKTILLGNIARFNEQKNHNFLINLFYKFLKENKNSKLLLIGEGKLMPEVRKKVQSLDIQDKVIFTGALKNANEYLNAMDVFVFPSLYEGLGIVAIEAQTNGLPVIMNEDLPKEINLTNLVYRLSLRYDFDEWIKTINKSILENEKRLSRDSEVRKNGYDIQQNARYLQKFYLSLEEC